ncbi:hypothetical protein [Larsenimonas salina]|uniref:hypothetical protein n=1 Tax=Larsenimonas salina TaxID=1295565 RepID=UPI0020742EF3|nr:hypothetical protein [Larsenimonas salina]MCM5705608.1 hypothetical protein [Larsenimonas salina]
MVSEPQRRQYLEAMGLPTWEARYRLPFAEPTEACEWALPEMSPRGPRQGVEALRDASRVDAPVHTTPAHTAPVTAPSQPGKAQADDASSVSPRSARALLEGHVELPEHEKRESVTEAVPSEPTQAPLAFSWSVAALEGRWLIVALGGEVSPRHQALLRALLAARRIFPSQPVAFESFEWPIVEGLLCHDPLGDAQDGIRAFIRGRQERGWFIERVLTFGSDDTLSSVLGIENEHSTLLTLPVWQGPALGELDTADAKRALWAGLEPWHEWWHGSTDERAQRLDE